MPLLRNRFQPYFPDPLSPNSYGCKGNYCWPVAQGDNLYQQFYQTPCSTDLIPDPQFEDITLGAELITNGTFASGASWTIAPPGGWVIGGGVAESDSALGLGLSIEQTGVTITAGGIYQLTIDVSGLQSGDILEVFFGGVESFVVIDTNGSAQTIYGVAGNAYNDFTISADALNDITIDNVSLREVTFGAWANNSAWVLSGGIACKVIAGSTGELEDISPNYVDAGEYYQVTFTVSNYSSGTVTPELGGTNGTAVAANGTYTQYITATADGTLVFEPSADFIGCISFPIGDDESIGLYTGVRHLRNDYTGDIVKTDGSTTHSLDEFFEYYQNYVSLIFNFGQLAVDTEEDFGCWQMQLFDSCIVEGVDLVTNGNFTDGITGWSASPPPQFAVVGGQAVVSFDPLTGEPNLCTNGDFSSGAAGWTATGWTIAAGAATHNIGNTSPLSRSVTITNPVTAPAYKVWWIKFDISGRTAGSVQVQLSDGSLPGSYASNGYKMWRASPTIGAGPVTFQIIPTSDFDGTIDDIIIVEQTTSFIQGVNLYNAANANITAGNYRLDYDIISLTTTGSLSVTGDIYGFPGGNTETTTGAKTDTFNNYVPGSQIVHFDVNFSGIDPGGGNLAFPGEAILDNVNLTRIEPFEASYVSECIKYQQDFIDSRGNDRTRVITAWCDRPAFGFEWDNTGFKLQHRMECRSIAPSFPESANIAEYGNGNAAISYAEVAEFWELHTGLLSEAAHACLAAQRRCDHFGIGVNEDIFTEYIAELQQYSPDWDRSGAFDLAVGVMNLRLKNGGQLFNRHT